MTCPRCGAAVAPGDRFCSECGVRIAPPDVPPRDGREEAAGPGLAGRTDPGVVHRTNQDAFALSGPGGGGSGSVLVVCDGVSNSQTPQLAAAAAARVAHEALAGAARDGAGDRGVAMRGAILAAHDAVCALPFDRQSPVDPPATTIVAAWLNGAGTTLGWLGDSRAYLLGTDGGTGGGPGRLLTRDHSWLAAVLDRREMTEAGALRDSRAHALVHCLGTTDFAAASPCPEPSVLELPETVGAAGPGGWLVLCSDGLWNYAPTAAALAAAAGEGLRGDAADLCARLVHFARSSGGHDNITVAAARWA